MSMPIVWRTCRMYDAYTRGPITTATNSEKSQNFPTDYFNRFVLEMNWKFSQPFLVRLISMKLNAGSGKRLRKEQKIECQ